MKREACFFIIVAFIFYGCSHGNPMDIPPEDDLTLAPSGDIPCISITTDKNVGIKSKDYYVNSTITFSVMGLDDVLICGRVRGRGNSTWKDYPKKPYKIQFDESWGLFGLPKSRNWILLAEYCDKSLLRTAFMCEIAKAIEMEYVIKYQHVELVIDGKYMGTYLLTEQVERAYNKVNIPYEGFIIENDNYYAEEPLYVTTDRCSLNYTFKHPDPNEDDIIRGDDNYRFISNYLNTLEEEIQKIPEDCESYKQHVDVESFAKWFVVAEVTQNWDPNFYYVLPKRNGKLKMVPFWDAEWTFGLALAGYPTSGWCYYPEKPRVDVAVWSDMKYFRYLLQDPSFVEEVLRQWTKLVDKDKRQDIVTRVTAEREYISNAQKNNFKRWQILDKYISAGLVALGSWEAEADYVFSFFDQRVEWMDSWLKSLNSYE